MLLVLFRCNLTSNVIKIDFTCKSESKFTRPQMQKCDHVHECKFNS